MCSHLLLDLLLHLLLDQGYYIHMDNFFSSPELFDKLCNRNTDAVGTLRANRRGLSNRFGKVSLQKRQITAVFRGKLMALRWRDKRYVPLVSSMMLPPQK